MRDRSKKLPARFYRLASGREPVREWFLELPVEDRKIVGKDVQKVEYGWPARYAGLPALVEGALESSQLVDGWPNRTGALCYRRRADGAAARLH